jgi:hypothetical protein
MSKYDAWKLFGKAPKGYRGEPAREASRKLLDEFELKRFAGKPNMYTGASELASLALAAGIPLATLYAAYTGKKKNQEGQQ